ncbi:DUF2637 domain-containing protein [Plantactinospora siamensis]|uniref:DUF2637 domain-containing protein n=1 Tax=Plantactinospora siamensis TaxID=555372 RepID=A0ABV6P1V2_9ACTN
MALTTISSRAAAALVAAVAGFASYQHIYRVAINAGEHRSVSAVLPLAIDGLILVATLAMLDDKRNGRLPRLSARIALAFGVLATLAANIASAQPTVTARMVAAVPAVSFMLAVEVLARTGKPVAVPPPGPVRAGEVARSAAETPAAEAAVVEAAVGSWEAPTRPQPGAAHSGTPHPGAGAAQPRPAAPAQRAAVPRQRAAAARALPVPSVEPAPHDPAPPFPGPAATGRRRAGDTEPAPAASAPAYRPDVRPRTNRAKIPAAQRVASAAATLPDATVAQIAARAGVSETTARRHLAATPGPGSLDPADAVRANGHPVGAAT